MEKELLISLPFTYHISQNVESKKLFRSLIGFILTGIMYSTQDVTFTEVSTALNKEFITLTIPLFVYSIITLFQVIKNRDQTITMTADGFQVNNGYYARNYHWSDFMAWIWYNIGFKDDQKTVKLVSSHGIVTSLLDPVILPLPKEEEDRFKAIATLDVKLKRANTGIKSLQNPANSQFVPGIPVE